MLLDQETLVVMKSVFGSFVPPEETIFDEPSRKTLVGENDR